MWQGWGGRRQWRGGERPAAPHTRVLQVLPAHVVTLPLMALLLLLLPLKALLLLLLLVLVGAFTRP